MLSRKHDLLDPDPITRVFSIDHARRDKAALLAADTDTERRNSARLLDGFDWTMLASLVVSGAWNLLAVVGLAWLVGRVIASIEAGVWL